MPEYTKSQLRSKILLQRQSLDQREREVKDQAICRHLNEFIQGQPQIRHIFAYCPFRNEPDLSSLIESLESHYQFGLPVIKSPSKIEYYLWQNHLPLTPNKFGILEPETTRPLESTSETLVLVPCLATNPNGFRLGYGGGYYDRFLSQHPELLSLAIVYQQFSSLSFQEKAHDQKTNFVMTEDGIISP